EVELRRLSDIVFDRTTDVAASLYNHFAADGGGDIRDRLGEIKAPTLVLHGSKDPLFPKEHGEALAREIPGARLVLLEGVGHQVPPRGVWDVVVREILALSETE
ncbi:MAG TPA: alpha/beta fold hydrolase, partial [Phytomonospora sp.]